MAHSTFWSIPAGNGQPSNKVFSVQATHHLISPLSQKQRNQTEGKELNYERISIIQLLIAGIVTEVCVAFPALSAREEGYEVFVCTDASGTFNKTTRDAAWSRMEQAGCQLMT